MSIIHKTKYINPYLDIKVVTWTKDSHGLFDYQSKTLIQKKFIVESTSSVYRNHQTSEVEIHTLDQIKKNKAIHANNTMLTQIIKRDHANPENLYYVSIDHKTTSNNIQIQNPKSERAYLIVRSLKNKQGFQKGYALQIGDIIKLGRIQYHVCEMKVDNKILSKLKNSIDLDMKSIYEVNENLKGICKICLIEEDEQDNFFISPCKCRGSCQIVHINCLIRWIESKIIVKKDQNTFTYNFTKFQCEICREPYPTIVSKKSINYQLFVIQRPTTPYIMLQSIQNQTRVNKTMYMIGSTSTEKIKLGRGHHCQIRITDISVSRQHAHINFENDRFMIYDNSSKFGTLIKLQNDLAINNEKTAIQIGRTVITCAVKFEQQNLKLLKNINTGSGQLLLKHLND